MPKKEVLQLLRNYRKKKRYITVFSSYGDIYYGYILKLSNQWVLLQSIHSFCSEGYVCLRLNDIIDVRVNTFMDKCMRKEGFESEETPPFPIKLISLREILESTNKNCSLHVLEFDYAEEPFRLMGRLVRLRHNDFIFSVVETSGRWSNDEPRSITYDDVSAVLFRNRYIEIFAKYLGAI